MFTRSADQADTECAAKNFRIGGSGDKLVWGRKILGEAEDR